ncbi:MAG: hypothetical protein IJV67_02240, partial [Clostridia bacterium]|nr:hypothetical protein [Clostridia bacterium]
EVKVVCDLTAKNDKGEDGPVNSEFLLYGTDEEFFYKTYNLYTLNQKELFEVCNKYGVLVYQSHPLRDKHFCIPLDPRYMHGVEVFNPHFESKISKTLEIANNNKLLMSAGSDVHTLPATEAGLYIPKEITNEKALADYLRKGESIIFGKEGVIVYNGEQLINIEY